MSREKSADTLALGTAIRSVRVERGYTQESFAARAGIDRSYYGAIERGEFNLSYATVLKIARGLEVSAEELIGRADRGHLPSADRRRHVGACKPMSVVAEHTSV